MNISYAITSCYRSLISVQVGSTTCLTFARTSPKHSTDLKRRFRYLIQLSRQVFNIGVTEKIAHSAMARSCQIPPF